jgi:hypothetical protein
MKVSINTDITTITFDKGIAVEDSVSIMSHININGTDVFITTEEVVSKLPLSIRDIFKDVYTVLENNDYFRKKISEQLEAQDEEEDA